MKLESKRERENELESAENTLSLCGERERERERTKAKCNVMQFSPTAATATPARVDKKPAALRAALPK